MKSWAFGLVIAVGYGAIACSPDPVQSQPTTAKTSNALVSFKSSSSTSDDLGVVKWQMRAEKGVAVLEGLNDSGKVLGHVAVRQRKDKGAKTITTTVWWANAKSSNTGILKMRSDATLLKNQMPTLMTVWTAHAKKDLDAYQAKSTQEYGCVGDVLWAVGGALVAAGTCATVPVTNVPGAALCGGAIISGPVAGAVSAYEDCGGGSSSSSNAAVSDNTSSSSSSGATDSTATAENDQTSSSGSSGDDNTQVAANDTQQDQQDPQDDQGEQQASDTPGGGDDDEQPTQVAEDDSDPISDDGTEDA